MRVLLCDADGNLFPSEEPAFEASAEVTNELLAARGAVRRYGAEELRLATTGKNFRSTAADLLAAEGFPAGDLEPWVALERERVTAHLARTLAPDPGVLQPLARLAQGGLTLAAVSSSALTRLAACFTACGLDDLIPGELRFSAEDSLERPTSKPDPAIYAFAGEALGVAGAEAIAVEDAVPGVQSAVAAGFSCVGNVQFVPDGERAERVAALLEAGAVRVVESWAELESVLPLPAAA